MGEIKVNSLHRYLIVIFALCKDAYCFCEKKTHQLVYRYNTRNKN